MMDNKTFELVGKIGSYALAAVGLFVILAAVF